MYTYFAAVGIFMYVVFRRDYEKFGITFLIDTYIGIAH